MKDPFLPPATNRFAFSQQFSGSWSGSQNDGDDQAQNNRSYTLNSESIVSFGESSIRGNLFFSDSPDIPQSASRLEVSDLYWTRDFRGRAVSAGLFQPSGNSSRFLGLGSIYGLEFYRSDNTRIDTYINSGTPIEVHMPTRGRVEVFRDGRLIHSEMLEAGNQLVRSTSFPQGAYDVEVKTFTESGQPLAEFQQYFTKDSRLPPTGLWDWNLMLGAPVEITSESTIPEPGEDYFLQLGAGRRIQENWGLTGGITAGQQSQMLELGVRWLSDYLDVTPEFVITDSGRTGSRISVSFRSEWASLTFQQAEVDKAPANSETDFLASTYNYRIANLFVPVGKGRFTARYSERDNVQELNSPLVQLPGNSLATSRLHTLEFQYPWLRNRFWNGDLRFGYSEGDQEQLWSLNFQLRYNRGRWGNAGYLRSESSDRIGDNHYAGFNSVWNDRDLWAAEVQQSMNFEAGAGNQALRSLTRIAGHRGNLTSSINYLAADSDTLSYTGGFSTTLATDGEHFSWGGETGHDSAVLVDIVGAPDEDFEVLVDGNRRGYAKGGQRSLISVPAFESYQINVKPLGGGFYDYQNTSETVTIYPGNMVNTQIEMKTLILVMGQLTRRGKPVAGATFRIGNQRVKSDANGLFQLEYYALPGKRTFDHVILNQCKVPVDSMASDTHWVNLGTLDLDNAVCTNQQEGGALASH